VSLNPMSPKRRSRARQYAAARALVRERAEGLCELPGCGAQGHHAHHKRRRSQGGEDTPANLMWLCGDCHESIHRNIKWAEASGYLIRSEAPQ
jgi:5-methylcytosine-specific restriction endonuclease McrA